MSGRPLLSIIAACYNEREVLNDFCAEVIAQCEALDDCDYEILLIDDCSTDETLELMNAIARKHPKVFPLAMSFNVGQSMALSAGLAVCRGDAAIILDSDLQHPPAHFHDMLREWRKGFDVVAMLRREPGEPSALRKWTSNKFRTVFNRLTKIDLPDGATEFGLMSRRVVNALNTMPERHRWLRGLMFWVGYDRSDIPFECAPRAAGETKFNMGSLMRLAIDVVMSFSATPIRLVVRAGFWVAVVGFAYLVYVLVAALAFPEVIRPGWASVISVCLILGGLQLISIGLVGAYVARIFEQSKGRPLYLFKQGLEDLPKVLGR